MKDFKNFIMRGNVVDMAVGIIIGAAFGTIVTSLVNDIIMPPIGLALGNVDFTNLFVVLKPIGSQFCLSGRCQGCRSSNYQLRRLYQLCNYFLDCRYCSVLWYRTSHCSLKC